MKDRNLRQDVDKTESLRVGATDKAKEQGFEAKDLIGSMSKNGDPPVFRLHSVSISTVKKHIRNLKNTRAIGDDGIPVALWKNCTGVLARPLTHIINLSLKQGIVPDQFKISRIHPLHKKGKDPMRADSYRPVSILPAVSKVLESVVCDQLSAYLEENGLLPPPPPPSSTVSERGTVSPRPCLEPYPRGLSCLRAR